MENKSEQIYYLISEENGDVETMEEYKWLDLVHVNNLFEVVSLETKMFKIIKIHKNENINDKFNPDDIIYLDGGMISFYTKNSYDKIDKVNCLPTVLIEKEKIKFYNEKIDKKIDELIGIINEFENNNKGLSIDKKYENIKNTLNFCIKNEL